MFPAYTHDMVLKMPYRLFLNGLYHAGRRAKKYERRKTALEDAEREKQNSAADSTRGKKHAFEITPPPIGSPSKMTVEEGKAILARLKAVPGGINPING